ncbi:MAG TPA: SDR family NAD(P)-dependent oxidoreductase [Anaerolineaceae bacterium]|nr:SDR family NAD(P)-dependent oxidoreductase [Anaerolineaceae bacterium]
MPEARLAGKVALVTGAGSGIGKASALLLAREGAKLAVLSRTAAEVEATVNEIQAAGGEALGLTADTSSVEDMQRAVQDIDRRWGRLDVVFANAGVNGVWAPIEELSPEEWESTLKINLTGTFLTFKYAAPLLKRQGGSVIVNASVNGTRMFSNTGASAYATSKAGQVAFAKMLALELAPARVRVNAICPGAIESQIDENTERRGLEKVKTPVEFPEGAIPLTGGSRPAADKVAQLVLFLASDASDHISGTEIFIDGAQSLLQG